MGKSSSNNLSKNTKTHSKAPKKSLVKLPQTEKDVIPHPFILFGVVCILCTFIFDKAKHLFFNAIPVAIVGFLLLLIPLGILAYKKKLNANNVLILILVAGFILRLCYVLYTNVNVFNITADNIYGQTYKERQHDVWSFQNVFEGGKGHAAYILYFFENGLKLPDFDPRVVNQFYHPPLHHMISAVWMRILSSFGFSFERVITSLQFLPLFYSTISMVLCCKLFKELQLRSAGLVVATSLIAFHPTFIILAGSINNDMLSITFMIAAIYNTVVWYKSPNFKRILFIALSIGLGMITKLSVALIAPPIAVVFLIKLIEVIRYQKSDDKPVSKTTIKDVILQYIVFGVVCVPIGLSYALRNFIRFRVPLTYVQLLSPELEQYIGDYSLFQRFFSFADHPLSSPFLASGESNMSSYHEYNPFIAFLKTSVFGEYTLSNDMVALAPDAVHTLSFVLFWVNVIICIASLAMVVYTLVKKSEILSLPIKILLGGTYFLTLGSFVKFSIDYPHTCSQDFRYAVITLVIGAFAVGYFTENLYRKGSVNRWKKSTVEIASLTGIYSLTALFCLLSTLIYLMIN
ncbi:MAG: glycosyltransferase family 39 protein [Clostridia bacterium]|nr:glycosyltransferase family 39 protein [Clostridia bacterium]